MIVQNLLMTGFSLSCGNLWQVLFGAKKDTHFEQKLPNCFKTLYSIHTIVSLSLSFFLPSFYFILFYFRKTLELFTLHM